MIWEGGHRIPLIMRWDNHFPKDGMRSHVIGLNDLFATLCKLAGVTVPSGQAMDSVSFADYIYKEGDTENLREFLGVWRYHYNGKLSHESIRMGKYKLVRTKKREESINETF